VPTSPRRDDTLSTLCLRVVWQTSPALRHTISASLQRRDEVMAGARELRERIAVVDDDIAAWTDRQTGWTSEVRSNQHPRRLLPPQRTATALLGRTGYGTWAYHRTGLGGEAMQLEAANPRPALAT
jgi:hypothetical protein